jgi:cysteinyl-tRNA synthetase
MLVLGKEKMSKSLGNIFTTQKFLDQYGAETFRLMCAQHHYRSPMEFSEESVQKAEALLERLYMAKAEAQKFTDVASAQAPIVESIKAALFDDFNTAKALGFALKAVREGFKSPSAQTWSEFASCIEILGQAMNILGQNPVAARNTVRDRRLKRLGLTDQRCTEIEGLLASREEARKNKDYALSDKLRAELEAQGISVMDGPDGAAWTLRTQ